VAHATPRNPLLRALSLGALLTLGCNGIDSEVPGLFAARSANPVELESSAAKPESLERLVRRVADRLRPPTMPNPGTVPDCSAVDVLPTTQPELQRVVLANLDVRVQTRSLVPRRVTERLESGEVELLTSQIDAETGADRSLTRKEAPVSASSLTREDVERIERQRYLVVFYINHYQGPALILRVGKLRREWFEGNMSARLVLFDTVQQQAICGTQVRAKNDVKDAPIRSRLQAETRNRLERALGDALRQEAARATQRAAPQLQWPEAS